MKNKPLVASIHPLRLCKTPEKREVTLKGKGRNG